MNLYTTLPDIKERLNITDTAIDGLLEILLENASRIIDADSFRHFFTENKTVYLDTMTDDLLFLPDDLLSVTSFTTDPGNDESFSDSWIQNTDYFLWPYNSFPKLQVRKAKMGNYNFATYSERYVKIEGIWGYGNGTINPWSNAGITLTVNDALSETVTLSANDIVKPGHTISAGDEQMYVRSVGDLSADVTRAQNGTTASAHAGASVSIAQYPSQIKQACIVYTSRLYHQLGDEEFESEGIGDYRYKRFSAKNLRERDLRLTASFRRMTIT